MRTLFGALLIICLSFRPAFAENIFPRAIITLQGDKKVTACDKLKFNPTAADSLGNITRYFWSYQTDKGDQLFTTTKKNPTEFVFLPSSGSHFLVSLTVTDDTGRSSSSALELALGNCPAKKSTVKSMPATSTSKVTWPKASLTIVRFLANPKGKDSGSEWLEIQNQGKMEIALTGGKLDNHEGGSKPYLLPQQVIRAGERKVFSSTTTKIVIGNTKDELRIFDPSGQLIDSLSWNFQIPEGAILYRDDLSSARAKQLAVVTRIVDGDTFHVNLSGSFPREETIRLLGVDTPEISGVKFPEPYAVAAKDFVSGLILGKVVTLSFDRLPYRDKYGRLLAYVDLNQHFLNRELIERGLSPAYTRFEFRFKDSFVAAEKIAKAAGVGLWKGKTVTSAAPQKSSKVVSTTATRKTTKAPTTKVVLSAKTEGVKTISTVTIPTEENKNVTAPTSKNAEMALQIAGATTRTDMVPTPKNAETTEMVTADVVRDTRESERPIANFHEKMETPNQIQDIAVKLQELTEPESTISSFEDTKNNPRYFLERRTGKWRETSPEAQWSLKEGPEAEGSGAKISQKFSVPESVSPLGVSEKEVPREGERTKPSEGGRLAPERSERGYTSDYSQGGNANDRIQILASLIASSDPAFATRPPSAEERSLPQLIPTLLIAGISFFVGKRFV